jgi:hypothetical protein
MGFALDVLSHLGERLLALGDAGRHEQSDRPRDRQVRLVEAVVGAKMRAGGRGAVESDDRVEHARQPAHDELGDEQGDRERCDQQETGDEPVPEFRPDSYPPREARALELPTSTGEGRPPLGDRPEP